MNIQPVNESSPTPLQITLRSILSAMQADYPEKFKSRFKDQSLLDEFKKRIFQKVRHFDLAEIADGYELWIDSDRGKSFLPTIPELVECIEKIKEDNQKALAKKLESERVAALPSPTIACDPLKLLSEAKNSLKSEITQQDRDEMIVAHEALLRLHEKNIHHPKFDQSKHGCAVAHCRKLGSMSTGLKGGGNFYCQEHYRGEFSA
jgi:hypothetical protein